jgi:hypothetical protein
MADAAPAPAVASSDLVVSYGLLRVRKPVLAGSKVDIFATYADVFVETSEGFYLCRICAREASVTRGAAPDAISVKGKTHNLLSHLGAKHPWELIDEHASLPSLKLGSSSGKAPQRTGGSGAMDAFVVSRGVAAGVDVVTECALALVADRRAFRFGVRGRRDLLEGVWPLQVPRRRPADGESHCPPRCRTRTPRRRQKPSPKRQFINHLRLPKRPTPASCQLVLRRALPVFSCPLVSRRAVRGRAPIASQLELKN